jgi:5-methylcytosine-specific restriction endonuclease McrA
VRGVGELGALSMPIIRHGYAKRRRSGSTRAHRLARAQVLSEEFVCVYCGERARVDDPFEAAHVVAVADGGPDVRSNYRAAHRSCNRRRGRL